MSLLIKLLESPWFWLDVILSVWGGVVVWRGLSIESRLMNGGEERFLTNLLSSVKPLTFKMEIESSADEPRELAGEIEWVFGNSHFEERASVVNMAGQIGNFGLKIVFKQIPSKDLAFDIRQLFRFVGQSPDVKLDTNQDVDMVIEVYPQNPE